MQTRAPAPHVKYGKASIIMMDALASDPHIALEQTRIDSGSDLVWEALGEAYGTNANVESYRAQTGFSGVSSRMTGGTSPVADNNCCCCPCCTASVELEPARSLD